LQLPLPPALPPLPYTTLFRSGRSGPGRSPGGRAERRRQGFAVRDLGGVEALLPPSRRTIHHLDAAAGGRTQAAHERPSGHAHGAVAVRTRLHHLYAHRLLGTVGPGHRGRTEAGDRTLRTRIRTPVAAPVREQAEVRAGGPRGDPPRR